MPPPEPRLSVAEIMNPRSVAVIGASDDLKKFGARVLHNAIDGGYQGRLVPINPRREVVQGLPACASIGEAPGPIDVAVIAVPRPLVMESLGACADAGVGCAIIITSGFGESGAEGAALQDEMVAVARASGMRLVGPNCLGLLNTHARLMLNSSPSMEVTPIHAGGIGFASQSGALMATVYNRGVGDGARFSNAVSVGNQADLELADFIEFMADDPATRVVTLYVEGFRDPVRFLAAAARCRDAGKPVLMVKAGRSADGARVARSHTASLAGDYAVLEAVCREAGVILLDDTGGLIQAAEMLSRHGRAHGREAGDGICVLSPSGGLAAIAADRITGRGLRLAGFSAETRGALEEVYVPEQLGNPLDLGALRKNSFTEVGDGGIAIAARDADVSALLVAITTAPLLTGLTDRLARAAVDTGKPALFVTTPGSASDGGRAALAKHGVLAYETLDEALRVLDCWATPEPPATTAPVRPADLPEGDPFAGEAAGVLGEHAVKRALARYGVPVTREEIVADPDRAAQAARRIGYPIVLKGVAHALVHKSDIGAVRLGIADEDALRAAWDGIRGAVGEALEGCLVSEMAAGEAEAILGVKHDAQFGPMLLFGLGGLLVELIGDVCLVPCPAAPERIARLARGLKLWPVFEGVRGRPALDVDAFADVASRLSWLAADAGPRLAELDVNPLIVRARGAGVIAVDATATLA